MTSYAGRTPKYGRRTGKADGAASFENRVFGVEVYCGPVEGEILIHTDELVRGGANFIVEVQRTGINIVNIVYFAYTYFCDVIIYYNDD
jgi:hypothetical protein